MPTAISLILGMALVFIASCSTTSPYLDVSDQEKRIEILSKWLESERIKSHIAGMSIVIVQNNRVLLKQGFGWSNVEEKIPVTPKTLFPMGCLTKTFTATLIAKLVDEGKLDWDDPVAKYIPGFNLTIKSDHENDTVTIRDLLTHRVGIGLTSNKGWNNMTSLEEVLTALSEEKPAARFRTSYLDNIALDMAAGVSAGKASNLSWADSLKTFLLGPLEMRNSQDLVLLKKKKLRQFTSYDWIEKEEKFKSIPWKNAFVDNNPAAGLVSNAEDMGKWLKFLLNQGKFNRQQVVSAEQLQETWTPQIDLPWQWAVDLKFSKGILGGDAAEYYGMGWVIGEKKGQKVIATRGRYSKFRSRMVLLPDTNVGFVVMGNSPGHNSDLYSKLIDNIFEAVLGSRSHDPNATHDPQPHIPLHQTR